MEEKKNILTYEGLKKLEDELQDLKVVRRKEIAEKIKEAREQGDLSENAEYDAAKDEQRDIEARIEQIEKILKKRLIWTRSISDAMYVSWILNTTKRKNISWWALLRRAACRIKYPTSLPSDGR